MVRGDKRKLYFPKEKKSTMITTEITIIHMFTSYRQIFSGRECLGISFKRDID